MQRNKMHPIQNTEGLVSSPIKFLFHSWQKEKEKSELMNIQLISSALVVMNTSCCF